MGKWLIWGFMMVVACFWCLSSIAEEKSDNYSVQGGSSQGTYKPPPQPPPKKCRRVCTTKYHDCSIDCYRGKILVMGGCIGKCAIENCEDVCE